MAKPPELIIFNECMGPNTGAALSVTLEQRGGEVMLQNHAGDFLAEPFAAEDLRDLAKFILKHTEIEEASDPDGDATDA